MTEVEKQILENQLVIMQFLRRIKEVCSDAEEIADGEFTDDFDKISEVERKTREVIDRM